MSIKTIRFHHEPDIHCSQSDDRLEYSVQSRSENVFAIDHVALYSDELASD